MQLEAQLRLCQSCLSCCKSGLRLLSLSSAHRTSMNYYELLGVKPNASVEEIKNAFFDKSKKLHPDRDPSNPGLHSQFVELNEAYRVLSKERSRREYDLKIHPPYPGGQTYGASYTGYNTRPRRPEAEENTRYWEQFHSSQAQETTAEERQRRKWRSFRLVSYCVVTMVVGIGAHVLFFRKLEEVHSNFMDEKDRAITAIYNESKERARVNGFKKQTEILRKKRAEFLEKYNMQTGGGDK